ncbi:MAG: response regulator [Burkholderiaceae bacterium]
MHDHSGKPPLQLDPRVAHALRTPLSALINSLEILRWSDGHHTDDMALAQARKSAASLSSLIDDLTGTDRQEEIEPSRDMAPKPGTRVLVVEDEYLLARLVAQHLERAGCKVRGPVGTIAGALDIIAQQALDCALVDLNLDQKWANEVIEALEARGIPVAITTGYDDSEIPRRFDRLPRMQKPIEPIELLQLVGRIVASAPGRADM